MAKSMGVLHVMSVDGVRTVYSLGKFTDFKAMALKTQKIVKENCTTKRCTKSPRPEPSKKTYYSREGLHPLKLLYPVTDEASCNEGNQVDQEAYVGKMSTKEKLLTCGLNDKTVSMYNIWPGGKIPARGHEMGRGLKMCVNNVAPKLVSVKCVANKF